MTHRTSGSLAIALATAALAASCGGGIGGSGSPMAGGGIGGSGSADAKGTITRFGSVFVGGIEFDAGEAEVRINGAAAAESDLRAGMPVRVAGSVDPAGLTGTASRIEYRSRLVGVVESVDAADGSLRVLGQAVLRDAFTALYDPASEKIEAGNVVEVGGCDDGDAIRATYLRRRHPVFVPGTTVLELSGVVRDLNAAGRTFRIGDQMVDFAGAALAGFAGGLPLDGDACRVGSSSGLVAGALVADRVTAEPADGPGADGAWGAVEGVVSEAFPGGASVAGTAVRTGLATSYEAGGESGLVPGTRLAVRGAWRGGALEASVVRFMAAGPLRIVADVEALDAAAGTVTVLGKAFRVDAWTRLRDDLDESGRPLPLADLLVKDRVELRPSAGDGALAAQMVRTSPFETVLLEGPVDSAEVGLLRVGGVEVRVGVDGRGVGVGRIDGGAPESGLAGATVSVVGRWNGQAIVADTVTVLP